MKITEIIVSAGRVVPHPTAQYSNFKPQLTLKAALDEGERRAIPAPPKIYEEPETYRQRVKSMPPLSRDDMPF